MTSLYRASSSQVHQSKVVVIGLDGVPCSLLQSLFQAGVMPNLEAIAGQGVFLPMETTLPPISSVAWASFMTGRCPGEHGIFGFTDLKPDRVALHLPSFDDLRCPAIWQQFPGKRAVVVNLPFTYPARPLNGLLIAGFVAPVFERAVYPETLIPWLKARRYRTDEDTVRGRSDRRFLLRDLFDLMTIREEVILSLLEREPWDLFIGVITGTDRLHHFFFDAAADPLNPFHKDFMDFYRRVDLFAGRIAERLAAGVRLIILSDHGFTRLKTQVYLPHILTTMGYLSYGKLPPGGLGDIDPRSPVIPMDPSRLYLNTRERFPNGVLGTHEAVAFRERLKAELEALTLRDIGIISPVEGDDPDDRLFTRVMRKEELYRGPCLGIAPDLVLVPRQGYDLKATLSVQAPTMTDIFTGMHTHDDAVLIVNDPEVAQRIQSPRIQDVAGLITEVLR